jgi:hypothetical protein
MGFLLLRHSTDMRPAASSFLRERSFMPRDMPSGASLVFVAVKVSD